MPAPMGNAGFDPRQRPRPGFSAMSSGMVSPCAAAAGGSAGGSGGRPVVPGQGQYDGGGGSTGDPNIGTSPFAGYPTGGFDPSQWMHWSEDQGNRGNYNFYARPSTVPKGWMDVNNPV